MARMKTFFKYLLWIILFYILSNILISIGLRNEYRDLKEISNDTKAPLVKIDEAIATATNGKVSGTIENNTQDFISTTYIKVDLYSKRDINVGTQYYKVTCVNPGETVDFNFDFKVSNVEKYKVSVQDNIDYDNDEQQFIILPNLTREQKIFVYITSFLLTF